MAFLKFTAGIFKTMNAKHNQDELHFLPLGGSGEIGMNLNLFSYGGKWLMVDCGISFADPYLPGIDLIMPDVSFIEERREDLLALVITHAHEDHVGAVVHLWERLRCAVYATPFTMNILRLKLAEAGLEDQVELIEVPLEGRVNLSPFEVEYVSLTHSIPEPNAVLIKSPAGSIFHTGDWKLDPEPLIGEKTNEERMKQIGDQGVLAMICDSTNVFNVEPSGSEKTVRDNMVQLLSSKSGRIFCSTFASNVARVETLAKVAEANGRHVCLVGRSLKRNVAVAREAGYLTDFPRIVEEEDAGFLPKDKILYICTGCQGEARAAMMRIAQDANRNVSLSKGDTVVFSSKIIPGNELTIGRLHNMLSELDVEVITEKDAFVHVSGHPGQKELQEMYQWIRPEIAVPVHGEIRHMKRQAEFARDLGIRQVVVPKNGSLIRLTSQKAEIIDEVYSGRLALDGRFLISCEDETIVSRRRMLYNGALVISVVVDAAGGLMADPKITNLGNPDTEEGFEPVIMDAVIRGLSTLKGRDFKNDQAIAEKIRVFARKAAKNYTCKEMGPLTTVNVTRIDKGKI